MASAFNHLFIYWRQNWLFVVVGLSLKVASEGYSLLVVPKTGHCCGPSRYKARAPERGSVRLGAQAELPSWHTASS